MAGFAIVCNGLHMIDYECIAESEMNAIDSVWLSGGCPSNFLRRL